MERTDPDGPLAHRAPGGSGNRAPSGPAPVYASAVELARLIRSRELSAEAVVTAHLERIAAVNGKLNAVVVLAHEHALAAARAADAAIDAGKAVGTLHGVPFTVKDWIDVAGYPCTGGDRRFRDRVPEQDATAVERLRSAGAIFIGKTNVLAENDVYGRTENPYREGYSPTGSSSGEAAIIAAGGSPLGLGSDSGGSIRQPAHACGIVGLKPSTGRVPLTGHVPFISAMNDPRTTIGPVARYVADVAAALPIISGPDGRDPSTVPVAGVDPNRVDLRSLRIAFYTHHDGAQPVDVCARACRSAAYELSRSCKRVEEAIPPRIEEAQRITQTYWRRPESESDERWAPDQPSTLSGEDIDRHLFEWDRFRRAMLGFMNRFDVIITPAAEHPAMPHGADAGGIPYTLPYSLTGWPCVVVRGGTSQDGMPVGVQVVGGPWRDDVAIAVAAEIERKLGGFSPPPG